MSEDMKKKLSEIPLISSTVHSPDFQITGRKASKVAIIIKLVAFFQSIRKVLVSNIHLTFALQQLEITDHWRTYRMFNEDFISGN